MIRLEKILNFCVLSLIVSFVRLAVFVKDLSKLFRQIQFQSDSVILQKLISASMKDFCYTIKALE